MRGSNVPRIDPSIVRAATRLRRELHAHPETANQEKETARRICEFLADHGIKPWRTNLGGHGVMFRLGGNRAGPNILLRADLDALPIKERDKPSYRSKNPGAHHACGHDGHMAMLAVALVELATRPTVAGNVYGLFQPAEETGEGAARVLADLDLAKLKLDAAFAIHNLPGLHLGSLGLRTGTAAKPSMGLELEMQGKRTHASEPERGRNPIPALAGLARFVQRGSKPTSGKRKAFATIVGVDSGPANYGVSPGEARLALTLRGNAQPDLDRLEQRILRTARSAAKGDALTLGLKRHDVFRETRNHPKAVQLALAAARRAGLSTVKMPAPLSASEDFGRFTENTPGALMLLGAGVDHAPLHAADYDFPDELLERGIRLWLSLADP